MLESLPPQSAAKVKDEATAGGKPVPVAYSDYKDLACNRIAWGDLMENEVLSGLNLNVDYLHTKFILIDPLTDDPTVITGSANFSDNSTTMNDENMLVIRGDKRVAEIYLTEFMRLFNHFRHRNEVNALPPERASSAKILADDESWTRPYFKRGTKDARNACSSAGRDAGTGHTRRGVEGRIRHDQQRVIGAMDQNTIEYRQRLAGPPRPPGSASRGGRAARLRCPLRRFVHPQPPGSPKRWLRSPRASASTLRLRRQHHVPVYEDLSSGTP